MSRDGSRQVCRHEIPKTVTTAGQIQGDNGLDQSGHKKGLGGGCMDVIQGRKSKIKFNCGIWGLRKRIDGCAIFQDGKD